MNKRKDIIPNNLKEHRKKCGYTQKQVANALGFSNEVSISHWEKGSNIPNLINLFKLSRLYGISPTDLYLELLDSISKEMSLVRIPCPVLGNEDMSKEHGT